MWIYMTIVVFGEQVFNTIGWERPELIKAVNESKLMYGIGGFFMFIQVSTSLRSTGAFEVSIDDNIVFSKLESG